MQTIAWKTIRAKGEIYMKATGMVRRIDDLGRVVIPKEIRRTMRIREGDPSLTTLERLNRLGQALTTLSDRVKKTKNNRKTA